MRMKAYSIIPIVMTAMFLTACGGSSGGSSDDGDDSSSTPPPDSTQPPVAKPPAEVTPPPEVKPPPVTTTELEGGWLNSGCGNLGCWDSSYTFSGNEYDHNSSYESMWPSIGDGLCQEAGPDSGFEPIPCFSESTEYGKFVIGDSFINSLGETVTKIDFNRELVDGESSSKKILSTYLISGGTYTDKGLMLGDRSGNIDYFTVYEGGK